MAKDTEHRLTIRADETDLAHLATIGAALRAQGVPFATRTAAIKHALKVVAAGWRGAIHEQGSGTRR